MKAGRTLPDLATELERQAKAKRDFLADTRQVQLILDGVKKPRLALKEHENFAINTFAHGQLAERVGIPKPYYDRMLEEAPALLAGNVNHWLREKPEERLIRTLDGNVRAYLSNRYRPLDNIDLFEAVFPYLKETHAKVVSCEVTEQRMYLKVVTDDFSREINPRVHQRPEKDIVRQGVVISNSEVGGGRLLVQNLLERLVCFNGMIMSTAIGQTHVGRSRAGGENVEELEAAYTDTTKKLDDAAFFAKVGDAVRFLMTPENLERNVAKIEEAAGVEVKKPIETIEVIAKRNGLSDAVRQMVQGHFVKGGDTSVWGIANAITRASQDVDDYEQATDMERLGGKLIELPRSSWKSLEKEALELLAAA